MSKGIRKAKPETILNHMAQDSEYAKSVLTALSPAIEAMIERRMAQSTPSVEPVTSGKVGATTVSKSTKVVKAHKVNRSPKTPKVEPTGVEIMPGCQNGQLYVESVDTKAGERTRVYFLTLNAEGEQSAPVEGLHKIIRDVNASEGLARYRFGYSSKMPFPGGPNGEFAGKSKLWWTTAKGFGKIAEAWAQERGEALTYVHTSLDE
jgi:hypothetical protein